MGWGGAGWLGGRVGSVLFCSVRFRLGSDPGTGRCRSVRPGPVPVRFRSRADVVRFGTFPVRDLFGSGTGPMLSGLVRFRHATGPVGSRPVRAGNSHILHLCVSFDLCICIPWLICVTHYLFVCPIMYFIKLF